jgi:hypothetical protein
MSLGEMYGACQNSDDAMYGRTTVRPDVGMRGGDIATDAIVAR